MFCSHPGGVAGAGVKVGESLVLVGPEVEIADRSGPANLEKMRIRSRVVCGRCCNAGL